MFERERILHQTTHMKHLLLLIVFSFRLITVTAQTDSITANAIKVEVDRIEGDIDGDVQLNTDTTIVDKDGTMTVHTSYYFDPGSGQAEKIIEKTVFGTVTTEIVVYYNGPAAILFSSKQWQGAELKIDFDYYFRNNDPVYLLKRTGKGKPDSEEILKWCGELMKEADSKKALVKNSPAKTIQKTGPSKKITETKTTDSTKKAPTKKPLFSIFKKKH